MDVIDAPVSTSKSNNKKDILIYEWVHIWHVYNIHKKVGYYQFDRYIRRGREIYTCKVVATYLTILPTKGQKDIRL
jgi:hypothetical protein